MLALLISGCATNRHFLHSLAKEYFGSDAGWRAGHEAVVRAARAWACVVPPGGEGVRKMKIHPGPILENLL